MGLGMARVKYTDVDLSAYVDTLIEGYSIVLGRFERGPLFTPVPIATLDEFERTFGREFPGSDDPLVVKMGLMQGAKFVVIRIVHCTDPADISTSAAIASTLTLVDRGSIATAGVATTTNAGPYTITAAASGTVTGSEVGPFTIVLGDNDKFSVRVGVSGAWGATQDVTLTAGVGVVAQDIIDELNAGTTDITFSLSDGKVKVTANTLTDDVEILAISDDSYSALGFVEGVSLHNVGTDSLVIAINAGADQTFTLTAGSRTATQIVADLSALTSAVATSVAGKVVITTSAAGADKSVQVKSTSTADTPLSFDNTLHEGIASGVATDTLTITAKNPGVWGDFVKIYVYDSDLNPGSAFDIRVTYSQQGSLDEYHSDLTMDDTSDRYVVTYLHSYSKLVDATDLASVTAAYNNRPAVDSTGTNLASGDDGLEDLDDSDWIGDSLEKTGLYAADGVDMSMDLMLIGTSSITVGQALQVYCENRGDMIGYMMVPAGLDPADAKLWRMGESPYSHEAWNSHRLVLEYGRPLCFSSRYDTRKTVNNLGHFASCISKTDTYYDYSHAPVGYRRGTVDLVEGLDYNLADYRGYQDLFADYQINYLMISRQQNYEGAVFWEQYTTQREASLFRDLNVVRCITYMRKVLLKAMQPFIFEPNHPNMWREMHRILEPQFALWKDQFKIYAYIVQTDRDAFIGPDGLLKNAVLNTGLEMAQGIYNVRCLFQPTVAARYINFTAGILRPGDPFINYSELKTLPGTVR